MFFKNAGFPEVDELVLVTVTKVNPNSVFVTLDHYGGRTGLIHISEISPGRIRNIRDFVIEGKKVVCKVLKIDKELGHIDLSLRRVTEIQRREFLDSIKQEQKAEKLIAVFAEQNKLPKETSAKITSDIKKEYERLHDFFSDLVEDNVKAEDVVKDKLAKKFEEFIKERIKPEEAELKGKVRITLFDSDGAEQVKKILKEVEENTVIKYLGAGFYSISVKAEEVKSADVILTKKVERIEKLVNERKGIFSFEKVGE